MQMVIDPPIGRDGRRLLYRVRLFVAQNNRPYPLAYDSDIRGAELAVPAGYAKRKRGDRHMVTLTDKGEAYLDRLMRCE